MRKLYFCIALLIFSSCTFSYKSRFSGVILDNFGKKSNSKNKPLWLDLQNNDDGFSAYGVSNAFLKSYSERILEAENIARTKILDSIKVELYDIFNSVFDENAKLKKQNFKDPMYLVENILEIIPINSFKRIDIYQDKVNDDIYVYGVLTYSDLNKIADKLEKTVRVELENLLFEEDSINSCIEIIKRFFNIFEEEKI